MIGDLDLDTELVTRCYDGCRIAPSLSNSPMSVLWPSCKQIAVQESCTKIRSARLLLRVREGFACTKRRFKINKSGLSYMGRRVKSLICSRNSKSLLLIVERHVDVNCCHVAWTYVNSEGLAVNCRNPHTSDPASSSCLFGTTVRSSFRTLKSSKLSNFDMW